MNEITTPMTDGSTVTSPDYFPRADGSRISYEIYSSPEIYQLEQERIFHGPTWSFVALEAELPKPGDSRVPSSAILPWSSHAMRTPASRSGSIAARIGARWFVARRAATRGPTSASIISGVTIRGATSEECRFETASRVVLACRPISTQRTTVCNNYAWTATVVWFSPLSVTGRRRSTIISGRVCVRD
jgi:hypothetical protein